MDSGSLCSLPVCFVAHRVNTAGIDPAIVEIEQRTDRDGVVDRFIGITGLV